MEYLQQFNLTDAQWLGLVLSAGCIGLSKTGVFGIFTLMVPVMAHLFGGKLSAGLVLPMLVMADVFGVYWFRRHAESKYLTRLIPWAFVGILLGTVFGREFGDEVFKKTMGIIIVISVVIMVWRDYHKFENIPNYWWFAMIMGLAAGFTTMVGNLAGAVTALFFLSMRLPKYDFIGTGAWFYLAVNLFKVPFHIFAWHTITLQTFTLNLLMLPIIALGAWAGFKIIGKVSDRFFRRFVIGVTLVSAILLFW